MSAYGTKRKCHRRLATSAFGGLTDIRWPMSAFSRFRSVIGCKADITNVVADFRSCEGLSDACRIQACAVVSAGRRRTSLRGGNRGGIRRGGSAGSVYGDLTAAGWLAGAAWFAGLRRSGRPRDRRGGVVTTWRWHWWVLLGEPGARGGLEPSATMAGVGGRHPSRFSSG